MPPTPSSRPSTAMVDGFAAASPGATDVLSAVSTFLFTDIEGSTRLWEEHADRMGPALAQHDRLLRASVDGHGGSVIKTTGDGMLAVFADAVAAIDAAVAAQRALRDATWDETGPLRVRMALHAGAAEARDGDYFGPALNRVARILAIAHGGQIICSAVAAVLARDGLPESVELDGPRLAPASRHRPTGADLPGRRRRPRTRLPAASVVEHAPFEPAGPADELRRTRQGARRGGVAHRAAPARDPHRHGRDRQDPVDAGGCRPAHRPLRGRRVARGAGAARRPLADPVRGRPRARCTGGPRCPGPRDGHGVRRRQGAAAAARQRRAPRRRRRHGSPNDCSRARRACTSSRPAARPWPSRARRFSSCGPCPAPRSRLADRQMSRSPSADFEAAASSEAVRLFTERAAVGRSRRSRFAIRTSPRSSRSASDSTASRWRSSSRQRASRPCRRTTSPDGWAIDSACWPEVEGRPSRASRRSTR